MSEASSMDYRVGLGYPKKGSRWVNTKTGDVARVMSREPVEGYIVARYKGAMPWLLHINDWHTKFKAAP